MVAFTEGPDVSPTGFRGHLIIILAAMMVPLFAACFGLLLVWFASMHIRSNMQQLMSRLEKIEKHHRECHLHSERSDGGVRMDVR
jgi:hypothetical protein